MATPRVCIDCQVELVLGENWREGQKRNARYRCEDCFREHQRQWVHYDPAEQLKHQRKYWEATVWRSMVRGRAMRLGVPFDLPYEFFTIPERCPILDVPLERHEGSGPRPNAPTVDRMVPELGYVPGNCRIISHRANTLRSNRSEEELWALLSKRPPRRTRQGRVYSDAELDDIIEARLRVAVWVSYGH